ncbi:MAG TPA: YidC/Oxa1 family membrane protein insertase, partial [Gammaproteobacteria bacterium]|nr:YidC/Oxa1 family membrane protein insertase [Gammaproteobacteria bacterium]
MEQQRLFLTIGLFFLLYLAYDAWQLEFSPKPVTTVETTNVTTQNQTSDVPVGADTTASVDNSSSVPSSIKPATNLASKAVPQAQRVFVETDVLRLEIDSYGGDVRVVDLIKYPKKSKGDTTAFRLMDDAAKDLFIAQSGFAGKRASNDGTVIAAPNHNSIYKVENTNYKLVEGKDTLEVNLYWNSPDNVLFVKTYQFKRGSYQIGVTYKIVNKSGRDWRGNLYQQLQRKDFEDENQSSFIYT